MNFVDKFLLSRRSAPAEYRSRNDSCLDQIEESLSYETSSIGRTSDPFKNSKRRATINSSSSRSSLMDITKLNFSGSRKFLSFIQKGFQSSKSKSINKMDQPNFLKIASERSSLNGLNDIVPIPIRETAIQGYSKTLFHKIPKSNVRARPLLKLNEETKFLPIHSSLFVKKFNFCVKIVSFSPDVSRKCSSGNKYELLLPSGVRSLGHSCHVGASDQIQERCPSCHSSQLSLFDIHEQQKHMIGYVFSCTSEHERRKWLNVLSRVARPNQQNERRREISLNLWIQEAKNVASKKRYFCEIYLDEILYARTTTKTMTDMLFWGEEFNLSNLEAVKVVSIVLWKVNSDNRMKKKRSQQQLICQVNIDTKNIEQKTSVEKWYSDSYTLTSSSADTSKPSLDNSISESLNSGSIPISQSQQIPNLSNSNSYLNSSVHEPMIRVKARYQNLDVLPLNEYSSLIKFLDKNAVQLLLEIESYLKVKNKEDLAQNLINVIHKQGTAVEFLSDLIFYEINKADDHNLILRGNTMASKAIEVYLKLIGEKYLNLTLSDFVNRILQGDDDCEVDPQKEKYDYYNSISNHGPHSSINDKTSSLLTLRQRQESLLMNVDMVWAKIMSSSIYFPKDLKSVFVALRNRIEKWSKSSLAQLPNGAPNLCDRIVSACIFLRYICPAILTPSLFGLIPEYPDNPKVTRTFTLVAKCIQTLANFSDLTGSKESYMVFMNTFIENKFQTMHEFLREISTESSTQDPKSKLNSAPLPDKENQNWVYWENLSNTLPEDAIDLSLCLAKLHRQLGDYLKMIPAQKLSKNLEVLYSIIEDINSKLKRDDVGTPTPSFIKCSQSYHQMKADKKIEVVKESKYSDSMHVSSTDSTRTLEKNPKEVTGKHQNKHRQNSSKHSSYCSSTKPLPFPSAVEGSAVESTYLMTQSMVEDNRIYRNAPQAQSISRQQVDKEWQEMLSKSNVYSKAEEHTSANQPFNNKTNDSPGYQSLARLSCNVSKPDDTNLFDRSSASSLKQSVKKCKQFRRQTDCEPRIDYFSNMSNHNEQPTGIKDIETRRCSAEGIQNNALQYSLLSQNEVFDSCSTETITPGNVQQLQSYSQPQPRSVMSSSISMPSFHSADLIDSQARKSHNRHPLDASRPISYDRNATSQSICAKPYSSRFVAPLNMKEICSIPQMSINETQIKQMKLSLNNLHQTFNARMTHLLLADNETIKLELERVRLIKQICDSATRQTNESSVVSSNRFEPQKVNTNGFKTITSSNDSDRLSVKKYLEVAENVLIDAQNHNMMGQRNGRELESLLLQIFETNQCLQNTLVSELENHLSNSDPTIRSHVGANNLCAHKTCQVRLIDSYKNSPITETPMAANQNYKEPKILNSTQATVIELIDAV